LAIGVAEVYILQNGRRSREPLGVLLDQTREAFVKELAAKEALSLPLIEQDLPLGPQLAGRFRREYARQRAELDGLCAAAAKTREEDLLVSFDRLARALLSDIAREERDLLNLESAGDPGVMNVPTLSVKKAKGPARSSCVLRPPDRARDTAAIAG
jgi:hypothetical protein